MKIIITAPSLDPTQNVSGVSSVVQFIIDNNEDSEYRHFQIGKSDKETGLWNRVTRIFRTYKEWKNVLNENEGENVIVHYSFPLSTPSILRDPLFMRYALKKKFKMVVHMHGGLYLTAPKIPFLQRTILKKVFSWDVPFIVLSEGEKEILQKRWGVKRVEVLPNCPPPPESHADFIDLDKSDCCDISDKPLVLGYLGRIEVNKGMNELLAACKKLKADGVKFKLRFAGKEVNEGEYIPVFNDNLNDNANNSFEFVGLVSGETKREFLRSLDVLVMPTYFEGLPMSLLECMSYGVVPVITPVGSVPTVVAGERMLGAKVSSTKVSGKNGIFIKLKDVDSIVEAVKYLDTNREILSMLSENAKQTIAENFSPKKYIDKLNIIYQSL